MSQSANWLSFSTPLIICFLVACGGKDSPPSPPPPSITVTPSAATIPLDSSVALQVTGSGLIQGTNVNWVVDQDPSCTTFNPPPAPSPCPSGWLFEGTPETQATYYAPLTPGTYHVVATATLTTGKTPQSVATITVTPVNPSVNVTGGWSGTLTTTNATPPPPPSPATLNLTQSNTGILTGTLAPQIGGFCPINVNLAVTGVVNGTNISLSGFDNRLEINTFIQAVADPSGQEINGTFGITLGGSNPFCSDGGTIALTKQ